MKKSELIKQVARQSGVKPGAAADQVDQAVNKIIRALRNGQAAKLPGLGTISPGKSWVFRPESDERSDER
jgi:nucleoid DNA-binding protein